MSKSDRMQPQLHATQEAQPVDWERRYREAVKLLQAVGVRDLREDTARTMTVSGWLIDAGLSSFDADSLADRIGVLYGE